MSLCLMMFLVLNQTFGQLSFSEVSSTHLPPVAIQPANTMDASVVDLDGDGDLDVVLAIEFLKNVILINDGTGKFEDASHLLMATAG